MSKETITFQPEQIDDVGFLIRNKKGLLLHDPGGGKTPPACLFMYWVWSVQKGRTLWAMPKHLMEKNKRELIRFSNFKETDVVVVRGTRAQKDEALASDAKVFIVTFPGLVGKQGGGDAEWKKAKSLHPDINCVVLDELQKAFSTPDSKGSQELWRLMKTCEFFCGMTGTLIKGRLNSAYVMLQIIAPEYYGNYRDFLNQHALYDYWGKIIGWRNHDKLSQILSKISRRRSFDEIYGKQEVMFFIEHVDMGHAQKNAYDEYKDSGMLEFERMVLDGANEGVNLMRLRQILCHPNHIKVPIERDATGEPIRWQIENLVQYEGDWTARDEKLREHLEDHLDSGEPLIIFAALQSEQERVLKLCQEVGLKVDLINGNVLDVRRFKIDEDFRRGDLQVVVGSMKTCATGFNWGHVNHVIFLGLDYDHDDFIQAYRRAIRGVRHKPLRVTLIQYRGSLEQRQDEVLDRKSREAHIVDPSYEVLNLSLEHRKETNNVRYD